MNANQNHVEINLNSTYYFEKFEGRLNITTFQQNITDVRIAFYKTFQRLCRIHGIHLINLDISVE